jgi:membrane protease YdiL (CAAX protease family)
MERTEPASEAGSPRMLRALWQAGILVTIIGYLLASSLISLRGERARKAGASVRLFMESMLQARQEYAFRRLLGQGVGTDQSRRETLRSLQKLAKAAPSSATFRRLAVMQYVLGDRNWKASLLQLRALPGQTSPFDADRELAMWRLALQEHPTPAEVPGLRARIDALRLGWFEHPALEAMYRNAGMTREADAESSAALRSTNLLILVLLLGFAAAFLGLCLGLGVMFYLVWRRFHPAADAPPLLQHLLEPARPPLLARPKADALYTGFLIYLATFAILRLFAAGILRDLFGANTENMSQTASALLSLALMAVGLAVPLLALRLIGRRIGLTAADVGFRSLDLRVDIAWGVGGYMVALPLIWLTAVFSSWLFRGFDTPLHPAVAEFAGNQGLLFRMALFAQAAAMAPFAEETMFRGVFYSALAPRMGRIAAILLASGIFAILHPQLPLGFLAIFTLGLVFNALYALRGSLVPAMVAHALNNGAIFLMMTLLFGD